MADWSNILTGALGGAGTGAYLGSFFGPPGTAAGAALGGITGGTAGYLSPQGGNPITGYSAQTQQLPTRRPWQEEAMQTLLQRGLAGSDFDKLRQQALMRFQTQTIPTLAERFAGTATGPMGSSRFRGALGAAGAGLERDLAAMQAQYAQQQLKLGLQPAFENIYIPQTSGALPAILGGAAYGLATGGLGGQGQGGGLEALINILKNISPEQRDQLKKALGF